MARSKTIASAQSTATIGFEAKLWLAASSRFTASATKARRSRLAISLARARMHDWVKRAKP
jgi:hypothetical protein